MATPAAIIYAVSAAGYRVGKARISGGACAFSSSKRG
jgi:hypothetical protein